MKGVLSGGRMVWVDKVLGGNQIGGIMCFTHARSAKNLGLIKTMLPQENTLAYAKDVEIPKTRKFLCSPN